MLIPLDQLGQFGVRPGPVLHVGAHYGEEASAYKGNGYGPVWWVEGNPDLIGRLKRQLFPYKDQTVITALVSDSEAEVPFHIANKTDSSSLLELGTHLLEHPEVHYTKTKTLKTTTVDKLFSLGLIGQATFMNLDVQGAELMVLKGSENYLAGVKTVYSEINTTELYLGCPLLEELNGWLSLRGFNLKWTTMWRGKSWGDGVWVR